MNLSDMDLTIRRAPGEPPVLLIDGTELEPDLPVTLLARDIAEFAYAHAVYGATADLTTLDEPV